MTQPQPQAQRRKTTLAQEATTWQRALPAGSPRPSGAGAWPRASARPTQAPAWLVAAGILDETRRGGSLAEDAQTPEATDDDERKPEEDGLHADLESLSSLSLSTLSTLTSSDEPETADVGT